MLSIESKKNIQENHQNDQVIQNQSLVYLGIMKQIQTVYEFSFEIPKYLVASLHFIHFVLYFNTCSRLVNYELWNIFVGHMHFMVTYIP
jgi:hypothetical protein